MEFLFLQLTFSLVKVYLLSFRYPWSFIGSLLFLVTFVFPFFSSFQRSTHDRSVACNCELLYLKPWVSEPLTCCLLCIWHLFVIVGCEPPAGWASLRETWLPPERICTCFSLSSDTTDLESLPHFQASWCIYSSWICHCCLFLLEVWDLPFSETLTISPRLYFVLNFIF